VADVHAPMVEADDDGRVAAEAFVARWQGVTASELSTSQSFLIDLCALLGVEAPHPTPEQDYMFERPISFSHGDGSRSAGRIDLYRRGAFVLESKKLKAGSHTRGFDDALLRARSQAEAYARALPAAEGRPPFVVVVDVGQRIELYAEFSRSGATYTPFPDPRSHRIALVDLVRPDVRERLRRVWTDPLGLDPSRESARVTRQIAAQLAELAKRLEQAGHGPEPVAQFLMRCLFTMFAEDVGLLPNDSFKTLLATHRDQPPTAMRMLAQLWRDMDSGGFSAVLANDVLQFNGKLFKHPDTLPLDAGHIGLLLDAARADWKHVEPAIFGTLLERALSPGERHKLGAHYTPRAYVERLVLPTVIEPLRKEWGEAQAAAGTLAGEGKADAAVAELRRFHKRLCAVRVLDPACGSGNFLYVTLEHLKRLEGEVLNALDELGYRQAGLALDGERADAMAGETVDPHNLLGIEINPRAAAIAEVVLWIGYLQWHFRTRGDVRPPQPVIRDFRNIENRDAVLAYDRVEYVLGDDGKPVTRWDGLTMKPSPVTGEPIPDDSARIPLERYVNPRKAQWPEADFVVGNPPFIGNKRMRTALGDGYVEALRGAWPDVPESADFVMYWWHQAALLTRACSLSRFGLITTNSIRQSFNRRVLESHLGDTRNPLSLVFAIPDHPWVDTTDGADVRIAITVATTGDDVGIALDVDNERVVEAGEIACEFRTKRGRIYSDLRAGVAVADVLPLVANNALAFTGMYPLGQGFVVLPHDERAAVGNDGNADSVLRPFVIARDLTQKTRNAKVIDFFPRTLQQARDLYPSLYQWILDRVKPEREHNNDKAIREAWWLHARPRPELRASSSGISRYILVPRTAKWFTFQFASVETIPDSSVVAIALDDSAHLGVLSSVVHLAWATACGGRLGVGNDPRYQHQRTFNPFAFPWMSDPDGSRRENAVIERISALGEQLDSHRKRQQGMSSDLTLTGMYNVLEKLRSGEPLTAKERIIHEQGLVSVLRQVHDELDAAVLEAYGWSDLLPLLRVAHGNDPPAEGHTRDEAKRAFDEAVLERLVALNAERAAEEARGLVRWLRPEFQNPGATQAPEQGELVADEDDDEPAAAAAAAVAAGKSKPWPKDPVDQVRAVADLIAASPVPLSLDEIGKRFSGKGQWKRRLPGLLDMLVALGRAQEQDGRYAGG
jgi:hypothetical protein